MMQDHEYKISQIENGYKVFLDDTLFGIIEEGRKNKWYIHIEALDDNFIIQRKAGIPSCYTVFSEADAEKIGEIALPVFFPFSGSTRFETVVKYGEIEWTSKNFLSLHWAWLINQEVVVEAVEDIVQKENSGIIRFSGSFGSIHLLVMAGIFLSFRRKQYLTLGLYQKSKRKDTDWAKGSSAE